MVQAGPLLPITTGNRPWAGRFAMEASAHTTTFAHPAVEQDPELLVAEARGRRPARVRYRELAVELFAAGMFLAAATALALLVHWDRSFSAGGAAPPRGAVLRPPPAPFPIGGGRPRPPPARVVAVLVRP